MADVIFDKVDKTYPNGFQAIHELDLEINDGEFLVLVGPSGCGKSTALRMIAGLEDITGGEMRIGGKLVNDVAPRDRDIAMVFQNYALYPHMTVAENIGFSLKLAKIDKAEIARRVEEVANMLELGDQLKRKPGQLSGGQRQRVAMGRAVVREPAAFLMDEPLSNLDAKLRVQMRAEIASVQRRLGVTTIYVTHDQIEAMTMGDRVAVLKDGFLQQVDTPQNLYDRPANAFVAGFIGSPSMNLFSARVENGHVTVAGRELPTDVAVPGGAGDVIVGIRPEDLHDPAIVDREMPTIPARVALIEALGSELVGHLQVEAQRVDSGDPDAVDELGDAANAVARFDPRSRVRVGDVMDVAIDVSRLHFFDAATHETLAAAPASI